MLGIYVHLPFCPYICPYCDFAKWPLQRSAAERYLRALEAEIAALPVERADTVFLGGGTPNAYEAAEIARLLERLRARLRLRRDCEITIEINPDLVREGDMRVYRAAGINRVSIGVQSFVAGEERTLGRRHTAADVARTVAWARTAGIRSVSLDLMFAVPGQSLQSWSQSLGAAVDLGVDHVSAYGLTVEESTPFAAWREREPRAFFDDEREAEFYELAVSALEGAGFEQYEISNFAKPGHRCSHNANYWENGEYVGLGVGAASYREGIRSVHTRDRGAYEAATLAGEPIPGEAERLEGTKRAGEAAMLALRTAQGVSLAAFKERYGLDFMRFYAPVLREYGELGLLEIGETHVRLTSRGRLLANDVCGAFVTFA